MSVAATAATTGSMRVGPLVDSSEPPRAANSVGQRVAHWEWKMAAARAASTGLRLVARSADAMVSTSAVSWERWSVAATVAKSAAVMGRPLVVAMVVATAALSVVPRVGLTVQSLVMHWAAPMGIPTAGRRVAPLVVSTVHD